MWKEIDRQVTGRVASAAKSATSDVNAYWDYNGEKFHVRAHIDHHYAFQSSAVCEVWRGNGWVEVYRILGSVIPNVKDEDELVGEVEETLMEQALRILGLNLAA